MDNNIRIARELVKIARELVAGGVRVVPLKEIKTWYQAEDVTDADTNDLPEKWDVIAVSTGVYGVNGCVYTDKEGNFYKITKRCGNLFRIV